jgi:hypothetical protein
VSEGGQLAGRGLAYRVADHRGAHQASNLSAFATLLIFGMDPIRVRGHRGATGVRCSIPLWSCWKVLHRAVGASPLLLMAWPPTSV